MKTYFEHKIADHMTVSYATGKRGITDVYTLCAQFEILDVDDTTVQVALRTFTLTPSGYKNGDSEEFHGVFDTELIDNPYATVDALARRVVTAFFERYPDVKMS